MFFSASLPGQAREVAAKVFGVAWQGQAALEYLEKEEWKKQRG